MKNIIEYIQEGISIPLTKLAAGYSPTGLISDIVFPVVQHYTSKGKVPIFGKGAFKRHQTQRALRAPSNRAKMEDGDWKEFSCEEHDIAIPLDSRELNAVARLPVIDQALFNIQNRARNRAQWNIALGKEGAVADIAQATASYPSGHYVTLTGTDKWSAKTTSDPVTNLETGKSAIRSAIGRDANTLILGASAYDSLKFHPKYTDKMMLTKDKVVRPDLLAGIHDLKRVIIGSSMEVNNAGALVDLWADNAILCYIPDSGTPGLDEPAWGYTIRPMEATPYPYVDIFLEEGGKIVNVRCTDNYGQLIIMPGGAYLIKDVV